MVSYKVISGSKVIGLESLNPYCSGRWSRTDDDLSPEIFTVLQVLILIVVEDGLVLGYPQYGYETLVHCLNPYCSGRWSRTQAALNGKATGLKS